MGFVIMGDMNVHHIRWLYYSNGISPEGRRLKDIADDFDLRQMVREPTRGEYLLDLVLSDLEECTAKVHAKIADHSMIEASFQIPVPKQRIMKREVWHFKNAAWNNLRSELFMVDWQILRQGTVDEAFDLFSDVFFQLCAKYIPRNTIEIRKKTSVDQCSMRSSYIQKECC